MLRKLIGLTGCMAIVATASTAVFQADPVAADEAEAAAAALVITDFVCHVLDGTGTVVAGENSHGVSTNSRNNNATVRCQAQVAPPPDGGAVRFTIADFPGLECWAPEQFGPAATASWTNVVSASGQATLTCHFRD
jgi:hypothetical protein